MQPEFNEVIETQGVRICFSNHENHQCAQLRQTHGDELVERTDSTERPEADAHYTQVTDLTLAVRTADCIPILAYEAQSRTILGVHAGWRGVQNQILRKSIEAIGGSRWHLFIGPHIMQRSFEMPIELAKSIWQDGGGRRPFASFTKDSKEEHVLLNLKEILRDQVEHLGVSIDYESEIDTYTDLRFESFRRDRQKAGRQLSTIQLLP